MTEKPISFFDLLKTAPLHDPISDQTGQTNEIKTTTCYMCACRCGIRVHLRDGEVRYIDGNPQHPLNKGVICAKGSSGIMKQHSPARITKPLRRITGRDRGDSPRSAQPIQKNSRYLQAEIRCRR
jgi:anaerobic selenocysteine-containing dehydrogenase